MARTRRLKKVKDSSELSAYQKSKNLKELTRLDVQLCWCKGVDVGCGKTLGYGARLKHRNREAALREQGKRVKRVESDRLTDMVEKLEDALPDRAAELAEMMQHTLDLDYQAQLGMALDSPERQSSPVPNEGDTSSRGSSVDANELENTLQDIHFSDDDGQMMLDEPTMVDNGALATSQHQLEERALEMPEREEEHGENERNEGENEGVDTGDDEDRIDVVVGEVPDDEIRDAMTAVMRQAIEAQQLELEHAAIEKGKRSRI